MKKKIYIAIAIVALLSVIAFQQSAIHKVKADRDVYKSNTGVLLDSVKTYRTKDSLNAASVGVLELKMSELEKYRAEDVKLIKSLETKNRKLESTTSIQSTTINELKGVFRDSIVYRDNYIIDTLKCISIADKWYELNGCIEKDGSFTGRHINRESLLAAATIKYKRFWGFLWYTNKVKDKKLDLVSRNPDTKIEDVEFIIIRE